MVYMKKQKINTRLQVWVIEFNISKSRIDITHDNMENGVQEVVKEEMLWDKKEDGCCDDDDDYDDLSHSLYNPFSTRPCRSTCPLKESFI